MQVIIALCAALAVVAMACSEAEPVVVTVVVTATPVAQQSTTTPVPTLEPSAITLPTAVNSPTPAFTPTPTPVPTGTLVPAENPTATGTPTPTPLPAPTATATLVPTPTATPVVEHYRRAVIQILEDGQGLGSAVVIGKDGDTLTIATARHVMEALPDERSMTIGGAVIERDMAVRYELLYEQKDYDFSLVKLSGCTCEGVEPAKVLGKNIELPLSTSVQSFGYSGGVDRGALRGGLFRTATSDG